MHLASCRHCSPLHEKNTVEALPIGTISSLLCESIIAAQEHLDEQYCESLHADFVSNSDNTLTPVMLEFSKDLKRTQCPRNEIFPTTRFVLTTVNIEVKLTSSIKNGKIKAKFSAPGEIPNTIISFSVHAPDHKK